MAKLIQIDNRGFNSKNLRKKARGYVVEHIIHRIFLSICHGKNNILLCKTDLELLLEEYGDLADWGYEVIELHSIEGREIEYELRWD